MGLFVCNVCLCSHSFAASNCLASAVADSMSCSLPKCSHAIVELDKYIRSHDTHVFDIWVLSEKASCYRFFFPHPACSFRRKWYLWDVSYLGPLLRYSSSCQRWINCLSCRHLCHLLVSWPSCQSNSGDCHHPHSSSPWPVLCVPLSSGMGSSLRWCTSLSCYPFLDQT